MNTYEALMKTKQLGKININNAKYLLNMINERIELYNNHPYCLNSDTTTTNNNNVHIPTKLFLTSEFNILINIKRYLTQYIHEKQQVNNDDNSNININIDGSSSSH